jgi:hypothetical protein
MYSTEFSPALGLETLSGPFGLAGEGGPGGRASGTRVDDRVNPRELPPLSVTDKMAVSDERAAPLAVRAGPKMACSNAQRSRCLPMEISG